jgi:hypothetical protein
MKRMRYSFRPHLKGPLLLFYMSLLIISDGSGQVNLQTGSATFSLPMFNWQDDKSRLNSIVALNYSSGNGLKVNDVASNVGQGWNLLAGGVITRMQAGEPDDQKPRAGSVNDITKYPAGYLYATHSPANGVLKAINNYPIYEEKNRLYKQHNIVAEDKELDYFTFTFNGRSGQFFLDKNSYDIRSNSYKGVSIGDSKIKISFTLAEAAATAWRFRTTIQTFSIQDENGLIFRFGNLTNTVDGNTYLGRTRVLKNNYCEPNLIQLLVQPKFDNEEIYHETAFEDNSIVNPYTIDAWYLAEIEDPLTHRKTNFHYDGRTINANAGIAIAHYASDKKYIILSHKISKTISPEISSIVFPDGHDVRFTYGKKRIDLLDDEALTSVDILYQGRYLSKFQLNTSYFILNRYGTPKSNYQKRVARLCLLSVIKYSVDLKATEEPYYFNYYLGSGSPDDFVPPPFFYAKDIWGYYNGDASVSSSNTPIPLTATVSDLSYSDLKGLCFLRDKAEHIVFNPKPGYAKNGLLKQIIYPTGGALNYDYGQNSGMLSGQNAYVGGVHVTRTSLTDGGYSNDCSHPVVTNYNYTLEGSSLSSLWGVETPVNTCSFINHYAPEKKYYYWKPFLGKCAYHYQYPGIVSKEQSISISSWEKIMIAVSDFLGAVNTITTVMDVANVVGGSTGFLAWASVAMDFIGNLFEVALTCLTNQNKDFQTTVYYNSDLNAVNPLPSQFKRVEVMQNSGEAGKTVYLFTSSDDYPLWEPVNELYSMKQRYASWAYGLPRITTIFDASGKKVREAENVYDTSNAWEPFLPVKSNEMKYPSCKSQINESYSQNNTAWENPDLNAFTNNKNNSSLKAELYNQLTGRFELHETRERIYKLNDDAKFAETKTVYQYNDDNYQVKQVATTQSNGDEYCKSIRYSSDFHSGVFSALNENNIIQIPVATTSFVIKNNDGRAQYLDEKVTEFAAVANGDIKPYRTLQQRFNQPVSSIAFYQGPGGTYNPSYKETQTYTYDVSGNIVGIKDEGDHHVTNIYGYNDKYIIASIVNADPNVDLVSYTSFEDGNRGGWALYGSENIVSTSCVGGRNSFGLTSSNSLGTSINSPKSYRLSFWATDNITVTGNARLAKNSPSVGGFTYYEYDIPPGRSSVSVSGNANIDELRLYPASSRMRTLTYDPLVGKTSECDENNRITYYEYDELARLRFIRDENKNILKMYEYNYAKQTGCPANYSNNAISEVFTKNDCIPGNIGSEVTYNIPAGKYTSSISQADADQKVQNELNANGQIYANTSGSCIKLYYNTYRSENFTKENCPVGYQGNSMNYSVPAGKYSSTIDQAAADQFAALEIKANGQAFANNDDNAGCTRDQEPFWEADDTAPKRCQQDGLGNLTGRIEVYMTDINPNSSTYNSHQWKDAGESGGECIANVPETVYAKLSYENTYTSGTQTYADVVVRFYSDLACTKPVSVYNLMVSYNSSCNCTSGIYCPNYDADIQIINGSYGIVASDRVITEYYGSSGCSTNYFLNGGTGYVVVP